jgi:excisionase family DNA binding protein
VKLPLRASARDGNGIATLSPTSPHGATQAPVGEAAPPLRRLAELFAEASEILGDLAAIQDIQLDGVRDLSVIAPVETATDQPSPGTSLDLLSIADIARIVGVGDRTVRRWRPEGKLPPALEFGGLLRWRRATIEAWIAEREEAGR